MASPAPAFAPTAPIPATRTYPPSFLLYCLGHLIIDLYSSSLGVLQPALIATFGLTLTQAGLLGGTLSFSSSILQPAYDFLNDRHPSRLFGALAPAVAGIFISTLGGAHGFPGLLAMVFLGGAGIASFHPHSASNATAEVTHNRARAMATFICSGTAGFAIGPALFSYVLNLRGLIGSWILSAPGILMTLAMLALLPPSKRPTSRLSLNLSVLKPVCKPMSILFFLVFFRSAVQVTFTQFLPLYLNSYRGYALTAAGYALAAFMTGATLGGLVGGNLADRFGGRRVIICSTLSAAPLLAAFLFGSGWWSITAHVLAGATLALTNPVNIIMAQQLAPAQSGTVSALMMGFAWGTAGLIFIPLTGRIADHASIHTAFLSLMALPLISCVLSWRLPK